MFFFEPCYVGDKSDLTFYHLISKNLAFLMFQSKKKIRENGRENPPMAARWNHQRAFDVGTGS